MTKLKVLSAWISYLLAETYFSSLQWNDGAKDTKTAADQTEESAKKK